MTLVALGIVVVVMSLLIWLTGTAVVYSARQRATSAADAAALAAAPVTFLPFGAQGTPIDEAARFASLNGTQLVSCECPVDRSFEPRTVVVRVRTTADVPLVGRRAIEATGRAEFVPALLLG